MPTILHGDAHITAVAATPVLATGLQTVLHPETIQVHEPTIAKVGDIVEKIPTAVSHQRITSVLDHANVVTPIVAPAVRTYTQHLLKTYSSPVVYAASAPIVNVVRD
ncbi:retinin-like [Hermetia illucens]|nr:retinin-like [Hermetia illucens]